MKATYDIPFRNDSGEEIPPFAVLRPDGLVDRTDEWCLKVKKPDSTFAQRYYVNGPAAIPVDGFGMATDASYPAPVKRDTGTLTYGDGWGPSSGSWLLKRWYAGGFVAQIESGDGRALFRQLEVVTVMATLDEDLEFEGIATASIIGFEGEGTTHDSGANVESYDGLLESGEKLASGAVVVLSWINGRWVATSGACPVPAGE